MSQLTTEIATSREYQRADRNRDASREIAAEYSALIVTLICAGIIVSFPLFDYDLYWHLANGREMLAQERIVNEEVFSYTRAGTPFSNHEWLAQVILFLVHQQWGELGLNAFKLMMAFVIAATLFRTCRISGASPILAGLLGVSAVLVGMFRYNVRPELFSLLGVAALGFILHGYRTGRWSAKALYAIPAVMVLWDWLHGAVFGLAILCVFFLGENSKPWLHRRLGAWEGLQPMPSPRLRAFNVAMAVTLVAMALNPYGLRSYGIFFEFVGDNALVQVTEEFAPPGWSDYPAFWVAIASLCVVFLVRWRKIDLTLLLLALPFAYLALRYSRATGVFALVSAPVAASLLHDTVVATVRNWKARAGLNATLALAIGITLSHAAYLKFFRPGWTHAFGFGVNETYTPTGSVRFVEDMNPGGNLYNSGNFGGYLAFFLTPPRKIFQYNHHTVFGDTTRFIRNPAELEQWNINYAIVGLPAELDTLFPRSRWARVYREGPAVVVMRRTEENHALIAQYELRYFHPARGFDELRGLARNPALYPRLMREIATYLAYREDAAMADLLVELLLASNTLPRQERIELVHLAMRSNAKNDQLASALR